jgi:hypothetical protein
MYGVGILSERQVTAVLLILCSVLFAVGGILYTGRAILKWPAAETSSYLIWERSFIVAAVVANVLGLVLLEAMLRAAGDPIVARLGMVTYTFGAAIVVAAETLFLGRVGSVYTGIVFYVVLAFLAQAAIGAALLLTGFLPGWVGWATIIWNLGWLVALPIFSPRDLYYPVLHHTAPLLIGIMLLLKR